MPTFPTSRGSSTAPWYPVHDQTITAISKNYRRSVKTQIIICAHRRRVSVAGQRWPGNRNDVIVARHTVVQLLDGRGVLGDGGHRGITSITTPRRDRPAGSSATTTSGPTAGSGPASNTSSPGSKTGKYCGNAAAGATPSTTASTSSPDSGTSRPAINYGSTLSGSRNPATSQPRIATASPHRPRRRPPPQAPRSAPARRRSGPTTG